MQPRVHTEGRHVIPAQKDGTLYNIGSILKKGALVFSLCVNGATYSVGKSGKMHLMQDAFDARDIINDNVRFLLEVMLQVTCFKALTDINDFSVVND